MSRKKARQGLVSLIFKSQFNDNIEDHIINYYLDDFSYTPEERVYILEGYDSIMKELDTIDETISKSLTSWTIDRLFKLDLSILRVAVYEMLFVENIPNEVSINEAVEIAKKYGSNESSKLINGILGAIIRREE